MFAMKPSFAPHSASNQTESWGGGGGGGESGNEAVRVEMLDLYHDYMKLL